VKIMRRRAPQLALIPFIAVIVPQLAYARDEGSAVRLAMGPTSAPQKVFGPPANSSNRTGSAASTCNPYEQACSTRHRRSARRHSRSVALSH
jgi:hypothetical protein